MDSLFVWFFAAIFVLLGLLVVLVYYLLLWDGMAEMAAVLVSVIAVPVVGSVVMVAGAQRYDHGR